MPRFKQPLMGLSRLSDRVGGGSWGVELISFSTTGTGTATLSFTDIQPDDLLLYIGWGADPSPVPAGFASILSQDEGTRAITMAYKIATASGSESTSVSASFYKAGLVIRGATGIGGSAYSPSSGTTSAAIPAITGFSAGSLIVLSSNGAAFSGISVPPFVVLENRVAVSFGPQEQSVAKPFTAGISGASIAAVEVKL